MKYAENVDVAEMINKISAIIIVLIKNDYICDMILF